MIVYIPRAIKQIIANNDIVVCQRRTWHVNTPISAAVKYTILDNNVVTTPARVKPHER
jgi:hypothetical protein